MARILYFSRDYTPHDHRFLSALGQTEHEVFFLQLERRGLATEDRPLPASVRQVAWAGGQAPARFSAGLRLLNDLRRVIRTVKPDLIHAGPLQRSALLVALTGFRPLVSMSWGYDLFYEAHRNALWRWATRFTLRRSAALVGDCQTIRRLAVSYGMPDERIVTFPWGVDLEHFAPPPDRNGPPDTTQPFTLLSTRGWEPIYGVEVIAQAFVHASRQLQQHNLPSPHLIMLGNGSLAGHLRRTFKQGGVAERVHFPGQISQGNLPRYYQQADLYVSASHSDGTSISLLEALACACPVLVSDIPGNLEWVRPGENGWHFRDGDPQDLASAIIHAVQNRARLPQMGMNARRQAEADADWKKNFPHLLQAYDLALSAPRR